MSWAGQLSHTVTYTAVWLQANSPLLSSWPYRSCLCSCSRGPMARGRGGHVCLPPPPTVYLLLSFIAPSAGFDIFALHNDLMCNNVTSLHPELFMYREPCVPLQGEGGRESERCASLQQTLAWKCIALCPVFLLDVHLHYKCSCSRNVFFLYVTCNVMKYCHVELQYVQSVHLDVGWIQTEDRQTGGMNVGKNFTNCDLSVVCSRRRFTYRCGSEAVAAESLFFLLHYRTV